MKNTKKAVYYWRILWLIGLLILGNIKLHYTTLIRRDFYWVEPFLAMMLGLYIALIFVKKWSIQIKPALLWCIAIPCILLRVIVPLFLVLDTSSSIEALLPTKIQLLLLPVIFYVISPIVGEDVFGIVGGLTLMISIFQTHLYDGNESYKT